MNSIETKLFQFLQGKRYPVASIEREPGGVYTAWLKRRGGCSDGALVNRFKDSQYLCVGYGHDLRGGHYLKVRVNDER